MPRKSKGEKIIATYFTWIVARRQDNDVFYADGRSNPVSGGRHSLGTRDHDEAMELVRQLDMKIAVGRGLADAAILGQKADDLLPIEKGIELYMKHVSRPTVIGGASASTKKRYEAVFDKFKSFVATQRIHYWQGVNKKIAEAYAAWLDDQGYARRTEYLEITLLKQTIKWMINEELLPEACRIKIKLRKPHGTDTYCYTDDQVRAIIDYCFEDPQLIWLGRVVVALVYTGMRIGELVQLKPVDVDLDSNVLHIVDESQSKRRDQKDSPRFTKSHRGRKLPIHEELREVLLVLMAESKGRLFCGPRGGKLKPDTVRNVLVRDVLTPLASRFPKVGNDLGFIDGRIHSFRHYFCSYAVRNGTAEQVLMNWLGHQNSNMVRHYFHLHDADAQRYMEQIKSVGGAPKGDTSSEPQAA